MAAHRAGAGARAAEVPPEHQEVAHLLDGVDRVLVLRNGSVTDDLDRRDIADEESLQLAIQGVRS